MVTSSAIGPIGSPSGGSQKASATKKRSPAWNCTMVPRNTPPSRPRISSRNSVGGHSMAYGPSSRGVVTECATCHQALSAAGSKKACMTRPAGAAMIAVTSRLGAGAKLWLAGGGVDALRASARDHLLDLAHQRRHVIRDAVLDRPLDAAAVRRLHLVVRAERRIVRRRAPVEQHHVGAVRIQQLEVLERVAVDYQQVGDEAFADLADAVFHPEQLRAVPGRVLDDLERVEPRLLVQLQLARDAEAVHRIDVAGIVSGGDEPALARELQHRVHPDAILSLPLRFLRRGPADEVRPVVVERAFEVLLH